MDSPVRSYRGRAEMAELGSPDVQYTRLWLAEDPLQIADHYPKFARPARFPRWVDGNGNPELGPVCDEGQGRLQGEPPVVTECHSLNDAIADRNGNRLWFVGNRSDGDLE